MFPAYFCRTCGKCQSFLTGYCNHKKTQRTLTWSDTCEIIGINKANYIAKRNRRIAMRRALVILGFMAAIWGIVIWVVN